MARLYSRSGCITCKIRKKKCDETRPVCKTCSRLAIRCSYFSEDTVAKRKSASLIPLSLKSQAYQAQVLPFIVPENEIEAYRLSYGPPSIMGFFQPAASESCRDLQGLRQLLIQDKVVRTALSACFSVILPPLNSDDEEFDYLALDRALRMLQTRLWCGNMDRLEVMSAITAAAFLGLIDTVSSSEGSDTLKHWRGTSQLVKYGDTLQLEKWPSLPLNLYKLLLEAALYNLATISMFGDESDPLAHSWVGAALLERLLRLNPEGPRQVVDSPFLAGQYVIYDLVGRVSTLLRISGPEETIPHTTVWMEDLINHKTYRLNKEFLTLDHLGLGLRLFLHTVYQFYCKSLQICIELLKRPSQSQIQRICKFTAEALKIFMDIPIGPYNYICVTWPAQILACALSNEQDVKDFDAKFSQIRGFLDPGHLRRADSLFDRLRQLRSLETSGKGCMDSPSSSEVNLPTGLRLLQHKKGVLH